MDGPGTCCFLESYLGFFPLASSVGCWLEVVEVYPWLSSLRSFAVEGVDLVLYQGNGWLALMVLLCLWTPGIGQLSQVRRCSSSVPDRDVAFPPLVGFALVLVRFHYLRLAL